MYGNLLWTMVKVTTDRGDLIRIVIMSWNEDLLDVDHLTHDKWVEYFKAWSRRSLFSGRAQTCRSRFNVWNSRKLLHVTLKFGTKILRSEIFAQVNLISVAPSQEERAARARCPRSSVEAGQKCIRLKGAWKSNILFTFGKLVSPCINVETWGKRICCRLRSVNAHDKQIGLEWCWNGYFDVICVVLR